MIEKKEVLVSVKKIESENLIKFIFRDGSEVKTSWIASDGVDLLPGLQKHEILRLISNLCREALIEYLEKRGVKFSRRTEYVN